MERSHSASYAAAGVDIEAGYEGVRLMREHVANQPHIALDQLVSRLKVTIFHFLQTFAFLFHRQRR